MTRFPLHDNAPFWFSERASRPRFIPGVLIKVAL